MDDLCDINKGLDLSAQCNCLYCYFGTDADMVQVDQELPTQHKTSLVEEWSPLKAAMVTLFHPVMLLKKAPGWLSWLNLGLDLRT